MTQNSRMLGHESVIFRVSSLPIYPDITFDKCQNTLAFQGNIFACYDSLSNSCPMLQKRNTKSLHLHLACPGTDNHAR